MENNSNNNRIVAKKKGKVVNKSGEKTVIIAVESFKTHSKYRKKYRSTKRYKAHDEENKYKINDIVEIVPCRPMSKDKKYRIAN